MQEILDIQRKAAELDLHRAQIELATAKRRQALVEHEWMVAQAVHDNFTAINQRFGLKGQPGPRP